MNQKIQTEDESFYKSINRLYQQYQEETNPDDKRDREQELILKLWKKNQLWQNYPDIVVNTVHNCLSPDSKYDSSKSDFSRYILTAIGNNIKKPLEEENKIKNTELPLEHENKNTGDTFFLTDIVSSSPDIKQKLTNIQLILTADVLREHLQIIQEALLSEEENQEIKARLMTREILYNFKKEALQLITEKIYYIAAEFDFIDKQFWAEYFFNLDNLPSQKELACTIGITNNTASQMLKRFKTRLKNTTKQLGIIKIAEG